MKIEFTDEQKARLRLWVAALRSGQFLQGTQWLAHRDAGADTWEYCCLGVACEVAVANGLEIMVQDPVVSCDAAGNPLVQARQYGGQKTALPGPVIDWYGLVDANIPSLRQDDPLVWYEHEGAHVGLSELNDDFRCDFDQIADLIEREFGL